MRLPRSPSVRTQRSHRRKTKEQTIPLGLHHRKQPSAPKLNENTHQGLEPTKHQRPEAIGLKKKKKKNNPPRIAFQRTRNIDEISPEKERGRGESQPDIVITPKTGKQNHTT